MSTDQLQAIARDNPRPCPTPRLTSPRPNAGSISAELTSIVERLAGPDGPGSRFDVAGRRVEYDAIVDMMVRERSLWVDEAIATHVAGIIAAGCLGEQHLFRDLGLADRPTLRRVLETYFAPFALGNYLDMRWKKYIYRKLCRWEGFHVCKAPSCSECSDYSECFAPEE